jgi:hypothetical protein
MAWEEVAPQLDSGTAVWSMAVMNGEIYAGMGTGGASGGKLYNFNGTDAWVKLCDGYDTNHQYANGLTVYNGKHYCVDHAVRLFEFDVGTSLWVLKANGYNRLGWDIAYTAYQLKVFNGKLYTATGHTYGASSNFLLEWNDSNAWIDRCHVAVNNNPWRTLEEHDSKLFVGNNTSTLFEWDGTSTLTQRATDASIMYDLQDHDDKLYGCNQDGDLLEYNDTDAWVNVATILGSQGVYSLLSGSDGNLYAGTYGSVTDSGNLFRWDATLWTKLCAVLNSQKGIFALVELGDYIYGGTYINGKLFRMKIIKGYNPLFFGNM